MLKKALLPIAHRGLRRESEYVDNLMHVGGRPILPSTATLGQMIGASLQDQRSFYMIRGPNRYELIQPSTDRMVYNINDDVRREIERVRDNHFQDTKRYGPTFASLRWGRPLSNIHGMGHSEVRGPPPSTSSGVTSRPPSTLPDLGRDTTHQQMVEALSWHGGFKFRKGSRLYTATLTPPGTLTDDGRWPVSVDEGRSINKVKGAAKWIAKQLRF